MAERRDRAARGNKNALKHGKFWRERIERRREMEMLVKLVRKRFYGWTDQAVKVVEARPVPDAEGAKAVNS